MIASSICWPTPRRRHGETLPVPGDVLSYPLHEPIGVWAPSLPSNFPLLLARGRSPRPGRREHGGHQARLGTPLTTLRLGELVLEAGFPRASSTSWSVTRRGRRRARRPPLADKVTFTGSTEVGRSRSSQLRLGQPQARARSSSAASRPTSCCDDVDLDHAVDGALWGAFFRRAGLLGRTAAAGAAADLRRLRGRDGQAGRGVHHRPSHGSGQRRGAHRVEDPAGDRRALRGDRPRGGCRRAGRRGAGGRGRPRRRVVLPPDDPGRRVERAAGGSGGDLRTGARGDAVRGRRRRHADRQRFDLRTGRRRVVRRHGSRGRRWPRACAPARCGSTTTT